MGCASSKKSENKSNEIDYTMEWIFVTEINQFFQSCEPVLKQAEMLRSGLEDSLEEMYDISSVQFLKTPPVLLDALKVWVWTLATNNDGDISNCNITAVKSAPYLDCTIAKVCPTCSNSPNYYHQDCALYQCAKFKEALKTYIETCSEQVKSMPELLENLERLAQNAKNLQENAKGSMDHLNVVKKVQNMAKIGQNVLKITKAISVMKTMQPLVPEAVKNMEQVIREMPAIVKGANEQAKKAIELNITLPADIMQKLHPSEKYTEEEIKNMKIEAEKKRKLQEEEKKKKETKMNNLMEAKKALQNGLNDIKS